eukprot:gene45075-15076_t
MVLQEAEGEMAQRLRERRQGSVVEPKKPGSGTRLLRLFSGSTISGEENEASVPMSGLSIERPRQASRYQPTSPRSGCGPLPSETRDPHETPRAETSDYIELVPHETGDGWPRSAGSSPATASHRPATGRSLN